MEKIEKFKEYREIHNTMRNEETLLKHLYEDRKRKSTTYNNALEKATNREDTINYLKKRGIIEINGNTVELEIGFVKFLEEQLEDSSEISIAIIKEYLENITNSIEYYKLEKNPDRRTGYITDIENNLEKIRKQTINNIKKVKIIITETYKNERNYQIKKKKLTDIDKKRKEIEETIKKTEIYIENNLKSFIEETGNKKIKEKTEEIKQDFKEVNKNQIQLHTEIINYINRIDESNKQNKIIHKIIEQKERHLIKTEEIKKILSERDDICLQKAWYTDSKPSIEFLKNTEEGNDILRELAYLNKGKTKQVTEIKIEEDETENLEVEIIDREETFNAFEKTGDDLYSFIMNYSGFTKEVTKEERTKLYISMAVNFEEKLEFTDTQKEDEENKYNIIKPKRE